MKTYLVFVIQAYAQKQDDGRLIDSAVLELIDTTADGAMARAKELVKKEFYRLSQVIEKEVCSSRQE